MLWKAFRLSYEAKSPIHIGWHTLGYIKLTRYYIPGKNMWGAATSNLFKALGCNDTSEYEKVGSLFKEKVLFSYFYPAIEQDQPMLPEYKDDGLWYGNNNKQKDFERLFISSSLQTAVMPETFTAEDQSLHESEFISPVVKKDDSKYQCPVCFIGYLFIRDDASYKGLSIKWENIKETIKEIFVGGDKKYGWGRLVLDEKSIRTDQSEMFGFNLILNEEFPLIEAQNRDHIPAHLHIENDLKIKGDIEPLVGREWGVVKDDNGKEKIGAGQKITDSKICWIPGSIIEEEKQKNKKKSKKLEIGPFGILKLKV